jgi:hypothetical protein
MRFVRLQRSTSGRFMPHNGAPDRQEPLVPGCRARKTGGGVMVHRLSVATRDRGAESSVYDAAPPASEGCRDQSTVCRMRQRQSLGDAHYAPGRSPDISWRPVHACADWMFRDGPRGAEGESRRSRRAGCRPARRKMVCKGHPCIHAAHGDSMTQFASSNVVPCGRRRPRKLSDVHGREG